MLPHYSKIQTMKQSILIFILNITNIVYSQCIVDAGSDVIICLDKFNKASNNIQLNAKLLTTSKAISVRWVMDYQIAGSTYIHAKDFLNDTAILNPKFIAGNKFATNYLFYLYITDSIGNQCKDSLNARISYFAIVPDLQDRIIKLGDTLKIYSIVGKGIAPIKQTWTPNYNISSTLLGAPFVWPRKTTRYTCTTIDSAGCISDWGDYWNINIDSTSSIHDGICITDLYKNFHNPIYEYSVFEINKTTPMQKIEIYNSQGLLIHTHNSNDKLEIGKLIKDKGIYYMRIYDSDNKFRSVKIQRD